MDTRCTKEYYTIHTDSLDSTSGNAFTITLDTPLKDVTEVSVLRANFDHSGFKTSNVAYLRVNELTSTFNDSNQSRVKGSLTTFNLDSTGRTVYEERDYSSSTMFVYPIQKLSKLTAEILDETGNVLPTTSETYISYKVTCARENLCTR